MRTLLLVPRILLMVSCSIGYLTRADAQCSSAGFNVAASFGVGTNPTAVVAADVNGDGNLDLVTANTNSNNISILIGNGTGGFGLAKNIAAGMGPVSVAANDFNSDGKTDLVVVNRDSSNIFVLLGDGSGGFGAPTSLSVGASPRSVSIADFNSDGKADLAVANFFSNSVSILLGNGSGGFALATNVPTSGAGATFIAIGDLNNDTKSDLVVTNYNSDSVSVLLGDGAAGFAAAKAFASGSSPVAVVIGDFNSDGKPDLATANDNTNLNVTILTGSGNGQFGQPTGFPLKVRISHLAIGDLNNDGKADLVAANFEQNNIGVLLGSGGGSFAPAIYYSTGGFPWSVVIRDLNHDNKQDVAVANEGSNDVTILLGDGTGRFTQGDLYDPGRGPRSVAVGDLNNDGKDDIAVAGYFHLAEFLNDGTGRFNSAVSFDLSRSPTVIATGDFDSDGNLDLVAAGGDGVSVLRGNGHGGFALTGDFPAGSGISSVAVGDFNDDGKADLVVANSVSNRVSILLGDGAGGFSPPTAFAVGANPSFVAVGDLNNDGHFDLIVANSNANSVSVLLGNGSASFSPALDFAVGSSPSSVAVGDLDGDGKTDLAVTDANTSLVSVLIGNGSGGFAPATNYAVGFTPFSVAFADFNGDNKLDLAIANFNSFTVSILLNQGAGTFAPASNFRTGGPSFSLAIGDFDTDGTFDLAVANDPNGASGTLAVLLNSCGVKPSAPPGLTVDDVAIAEGDHGTTLATFTVALSSVSSQTVSVSYLTKGQNASDGLDFQTIGGRLVFAPGQMSHTIAVPIVGDTLDEFDETFALALSSPLNAPTTRQRGICTIRDEDPPPTVSVNDVSVLEGDDGTTPVNFTLVLSTASGKPISLQYGTTDVTASAGSDYIATVGSISLGPGETNKTVTVLVKGDNQNEPNETFALNLTNPANVTVARGLAIGSIINDDTPTLRFAAPSFGVSEDAGAATISITRSGDPAIPVTVDYSTADRTAKQSQDYTLAAGTLGFGPGETVKSFVVLITDDLYVEGNETVDLTLSNSTGGAVIGSPQTSVLTIVDGDSLPPSSNPLDNPDAQFFVRQHYFDFLNRVPDHGGLDYWTSQIMQCGADQNCIRAKRIDVSNAFFYELEYQQTGSYVYLVYRAAFGNNQPTPNADNSNQAEAKKLPGYLAFGPDRARVVGGANLAQGQSDFGNAFVQRSEFLAKYPASLDGPSFVDSVLATIKNDIGVDLASQRSALINLFNQAGGGNGGRGAVLYRLADDNVQTNPINNRSFIDAEYNRAFVATQYFGYLRRDSDIAGFLFWLDKVNHGPLRDGSTQHGMVCSFITSAEYQQRFSSVVTHSNSECPQ